MGDPRKLKNKYMTPKKLYDKNRIIEENKLKEKYGLRRNKEIWRAKTLLRNFRERARALIAREDEKEKEVLFRKLRDYGLISEGATLEDVLKLSVEDILSRRLQTMVYKKKMANTPLQARQFIVHGHVTVNGIRVRTPSYLVKVEEEDTISFTPGSSLSKMFEIKESGSEEEKGKKKKGEVVRNTDKKDEGEKSNELASDSENKDDTKGGKEKVDEKQGRGKDKDSHNNENSKDENNNKNNKNSSSTQQKNVNKGK